MAQDSPSFCQSLFFGEVADEGLFPFPRPSRSESEAIARLLDGVRRFAAAHVDPSAIDHGAAIPDDVLDGLRDLGLFGLVADGAEGGTVLSHTGRARVFEELAYIDASVALTLATHDTMALEAIRLFATPDTAARLVGPLARGERTGAFALSESTAGSDAAGVLTRAERDDEGWSLTGEKIWVTGGDRADVFVVFARTSPKLDGAKPRLTAFVVERGEGVTTERGPSQLGVRGATSAILRLDRARVRENHVLGETGRGFRVAMEVLNRSRVAIAASALGVSKRLVRLSVERSLERRAFGRPIAEFALTKDKLARSMADVYGLESVAYMTSGLVDAGAAEFAIEAAICKVLGAETASRVAHEAMQIGAGYGFGEGSPFERLFRDARVFHVFAGTTETLRCFVALAGMQGPSAKISDVASAVREPIKGFGLLSELALRRARTALGPRPLAWVDARLAHHGPRLVEHAAALGRAVDRSVRRHGKNIVEMQFTQQRIATCAIELYVAACILSRTSHAIERRGEDGARRELDLAAVRLSIGERRVARALASLEGNDDELRKAVAERACVDGGYPLELND